MTSPTLLLNRADEKVEPVEILNEISCDELIDIHWQPGD